MGDVREGFNMMDYDGWWMIEDNGWGSMMGADGWLMMKNDGALWWRIMNGNGGWRKMDADADDYNWKQHPWGNVF